MSFAWNPQPRACAVVGDALGCPVSDGRMVAFRGARKGELRGEESPGSTEKRCRLTAGEGNLRESATENKPPERLREGKGETVR